MSRTPRPAAARGEITAKELAEVLRVSPRTIRKLAAKGELPVTLTGDGGGYRFSLLEAVSWLGGEGE